MRARACLSAVLVSVLAAATGAPSIGEAGATPASPSESTPAHQSSSLSAPAGTWTKNIKISTDIAQHPVYTEPHMAVTPSGALVAGFKEADSNTGGGQAVGVTYSTDGGATWSPAKQHSGGSDIVFAVDENASVYLNRLGGGCGGSGICTYKSTDGGQSWGSAVATSFGSGFADKNWIDSDHKGRIYHVYDPGSDRPAATVSTDGGVSFKGDYTFADPSGGYGYPVVAGDRVNGGAHVCYRNGGSLYFDKSKDGVTWSTDINLGSIADSPPMCMVTVDKVGRVFVAFPRTVSGRGTDVIVRVSEDGGATFGAAVTINDDTGSGDQYQIQGFLAADSRNLMHAIWRDERSGAQQMWYSNSSDGGKTWSPNIQVTDADTPTSYTRPGEYGGLVVGPDDTLYAVWADGRDDGDTYQDIYFSKMTQGAGGNNTAPAAPAVAGPGAGLTNTSYTYNSSSIDPDNDQVKITIDWGDQTADTSPMVNSGQNVQLSHQWAAKGTYSVKAQATDSKGAASAWGSALQVTIDWKGGPQNNAPAPPSVTGPQSGKVSQSIPYAAQGTDPDNDAVKYTVDWGDSKQDTGPLVASGASYNFAHAWTAVGKYTVKAMSTDVRGATSAWGPSITVDITDAGGGNSAPAAPVVSGPSSLAAGAAGQYSATATDPDNDQVKYVIDWGDSTQGTTPMVASGGAGTLAHSWSSAGTYQVKAKTVDAPGAESAWGSPISVKVSEAPDNKPPTIQHTPVKQATEGSDVEIKATITDDLGVAEAFLKHRAAGASTWKSLAMAMGSGGEYTSTIPGADVKPSTIEYYIEASDATGNVARDPAAGEAAPHEIAVSAKTGGGGGSIMDTLAGPAGMLLLLALAAVIAGLVAFALLRRRKRQPLAAAPGYGQGPAPWSLEQPAPNPPPDPGGPGK